jgi:2-dehydropantoate 2-reductase
MEFVVYGAGAVGSVLGGMLSLHQHGVTLIGRRALVEAVNADGLRIKSATAEYVAHPRVAESISKRDIGESICVLLTVKAHDVAAAVESLGRLLPPDAAIVCFQNGVASEDVVARRFPRVFGGVVRMTCSMVQPGHASLRAAGRVIVGLHPKGADPLARALAEAFSAAGFDAAASRAITSDKWLKLAVNTQSVFHAVIETRDHDANEFHELKVSVLDETRAVLKAARIRARSCDGRDSSIEEMIAELRRPRARRGEHGVKVHNSVWQDLYLKRGRLEASGVHGPLIALGREHGVPTPYNAGALDIAQRCHAAAAGPESMRLADVLAVIDRHRGAK